MLDSERGNRNCTCFDPVILNKAASITTGSNKQLLPKTNNFFQKQTMNFYDLSLSSASNSLYSIPPLERKVLLEIAIRFLRLEGIIELKITDVGELIISEESWEISLNPALGFECVIPRSEFISLAWDCWGKLILKQVLITEVSINPKFSLLDAGSWTILVLDESDKLFCSVSWWQASREWTLTINGSQFKIGSPAKLKLLCNLIFANVPPSL